MYQRHTDANQNLDHRQSILCGVEADHHEIVMGSRPFVTWT